MFSDRLLDVRQDYTSSVVNVAGQFRSYNRHEEGNSRLMLSVFVQEAEFLEEEPGKDRETTGFSWKALSVINWMMQAVTWCKSRMTAIFRKRYKKVQNDGRWADDIQQALILQAVSGWLSQFLRNCYIFVTNWKLKLRFF